MKIVINNGYLIDPKNNISEKLNIAIENGKIIEISKLEIKGNIVIDARNLYITPGFVDMHMHEDPFEDGEININIFEKMLRMGVTSAIGGNCGIGSPYIKDYLKKVDKGFIVNYGTFLPHEILRKAINKNNRYETLSEYDIQQMYKLGKKIIEENQLLGISFGIEYIPGIDSKELITLGRLGEGKVVSAHLREDSKDVFKSLEEFCKIGKHIKTHLQVSHIGSMAGYGQMEEFLEKIDNKNKNGLKISCDCYPYTAFSTFIGSAVFDNNYIENHGTQYDLIEIVSGSYKGKRCTKELFEQLRKDEPKTLIAGHLMLEEDIDLALKNKYTAIVSDGLLGEDGNGHPRATGSFPRFLSKYVRDKKILTLEKAIEKITSYPAEILGISKGSLEIGADADATIFSLEEIEDKSDFINSNTNPVGIKFVIINGKIVLDNGNILNMKSGKSLRRE
ncbi:MAG: amidohydrolase family protein [Fusobacteriaceae bacterium]